jgi:two-component system capsular synthesis response regulator RcsB
MSQETQKHLRKKQAIIADDHSLARFALRMLLDKNEDICVSAIADSPAALLEALSKSQCDLLITDFSMPSGPGEDGLEMLHRIRSEYPDLAIVVLTMVSNVVTLRSILDAGVQGLVDKMAGTAEVLNSIATVLRGDCFLSQANRERLRSASGTGHVGMEGLSDKERDVLQMVMSGLTGMQIARKLDRSYKTISRHKRSAMSKLGLTSDFDIHMLAGVKRYGYLRDAELQSRGLVSAPRACEDHLADRQDDL